MVSATVESGGTPKASRIHWQLGIALTFVTVTLARVIYVSLYAMPIPFWDQWDELNQQFRPWLDGTWHFVQLFAPHAEHRVLFTRLGGMLLIALNGNTFDNLVVTYANALIYAVVWALAFALLTRNVSRNECLAVLAFVIVLGTLPFDWENVVVGFQNQFYFLELSAIVLLGLATWRDEPWPVLVTLFLVALASLFTMASGLLAAPVACVVVIFRAWRHRLRPGFLPAVILAMLAVALLGLVLLMHTQHNTGYEARNAAEFLRGCVTALMWPLQPYRPERILFALIIWSPLVIWLWRFGRTRTADATAIFAAGLAIWVFLQCLAIAYSRGHGLNALAWRYMEIPALGLAANFALALKLAGGSLPSRRRIALAAIVLATALTAWIFHLRTPMDFEQMVVRHHFSRIETANVSRYFAGHPLPKLPAADLGLPYPNATRLQQFLGMPGMRALLPPSLFPPPASHNAAPLSAWASRFQQSVQHLFRADAEQPVSMQVAFKPYTGVLPDVTANHQCALDGIDGHPAASIVSITQRNIATFDGWLGDGHGRVPRQALLVLQSSHGAYAAPIVPDIDRPDVAKAWKRHGLAESGFHLVSSPAGVAPGRYALYVTAARATDATCDLHRTLTIR